jgi:hypothetical protein
MLDTKTVKVKVVMPEELRRLAKVCAASAGTTLNGLIVQALAKELKQAGGNVVFNFDASINAILEDE